VTFAPTVAIWVQELRDRGARSILKRVSFEELSFQVRFTWLVEAGTAERPFGAIGTLCGVVAFAVFE
jgi:hypothetical protein